MDDWTDKHEDRDMEIDEEIEKLEDKREQYRDFSDEQKAVSGVLVTHYDGEVRFELGLVKKEDIKAAFPPAESVNSSGTASVDHSGSVGVVESQALNQDLDTFKLQALQSEIMKDDKLSYDLMVFSIAVQFLGEHFSRERLLSVSIERSNPCLL